MNVWQATVRGIPFWRDSYRPVRLQSTHKFDLRPYVLQRSIIFDKRPTAFTYCVSKYRLWVRMVEKQPFVNYCCDEIDTCLSQIRLAAIRPPKINHLRIKNPQPLLPVCTNIGWKLGSLKGNSPWAIALWQHSYLPIRLNNTHKFDSRPYVVQTSSFFEINTLSRYFSYVQV